jgi:hypothetical protein
MKSNSAEINDYFEVTDMASSGAESQAPASKFSYASILRTLGHALESHRVVACNLTVENDTYKIKGTALPSATTRRSLLRSIREIFVRRDESPRPDLITNRIELRYSLDDIRAMDTQVRDRRSTAPEIPDPLSMSQLLRVIGGFLDKRAEEELLGINIDDRWVTITHASRDGRLLKTNHDIEYFYDLWVKMYLQRSSRSHIPPPSGPTVCIAGERSARAVSHSR